MKAFVMAFVAVAFLAGSAFASDETYLNSGGAAAAVTMEGLQQDGTPDWGTSINASSTYVAHAFNPIDSGVTYAFGVFGGNLAVFRNNATGNPWMEAEIHVPSGAQIRAVEFRFCDTSTTKGFASFLTINPKAGTVTQPVMVTSTAAEAPGCVNRTFTLAAPLTVDNGNNAYSLEVNLGPNPGDNTIVLAQARVYYRLQVSAAPATATFPNDVPTSHPFFRFIEAMAASGITGGCGTGQYCPDQPVTRGQMAVFLSTALGLHFPD